jgi:peptidoglycan/xylan/chitin deacetylase (PgdA/CDA1 family)
MTLRAVLMFHSVDDGAGPLSYAPADFETLLATLGAADLPVVDLDTLLAAPTRRGVALTFDDGMRSVLEVALPILNWHRAPAHLFLGTRALEAPSPGAYAMLTWDELARLAQSGVAIESHTHSHRDLRLLPDAEIDAECAQADALIERYVGRRPRYFAYPFGRCNARVEARIGIRYAAAFTTRMGFLSPRARLSRLPRLDAHYLRGALARVPLTAPPLRAYLMCRKALRLLKGSE